MKQFGGLADNFATVVLTARVVRVPHAQHAVYKSNPAEVVPDIEEFVGGLN